MKKVKQKRSLKSIYSKNSILIIPIRYLILLILTIILILPVSNPRIYFVLTPLTIYPVIYLLKLFVNVSVMINSQTLNYLLVLGEKTIIEIVPSCIAGAAYILLLILNLSIPLKAKKRIITLLFSFLIFLIFNILRIIIFSLLYHNSVPLVDFTHIIFWYVISTFFVIAIWFFIVKIYKIKEIPFYSDIKYILYRIKHK